MEWPKLRFIVFLLAFTLVNILTPMTALPLLTKVGAEMLALASAVGMLIG